MLCIKRKQETIICSDLVTDDMASSIVLLHCMTGCDANSSFYGKGKKSVYDLVMKSSVAQQQLLWCGDKLDIEIDVVEDLFEFMRHVIYGDRKSKTMAEARAIKWKSMKSKEGFLVKNPSLKHHASPIGHGWELLDGHCRPVRHTKPALPMHLPAPNITEASENDESDDDDGKDVDTQEEIQDSSEDDSECSDSS